jgi:MFS transporter, DHA2 family, multidrug resistance protein
MKSTETRRWWALGALAVSVLVVGLDLFVLNLALPTLSDRLHASSADLQWFVASYSLVLAATLLPAGLLGDRYGRKRLLTGALVLFGLASLACAYASSSGELIAARAVLGLGAAVILPMSLAVIPVLFTAQERPKAIAIVGGSAFIGYPVGPILGGWLLDHFWWGSVFLINVPVVAIAVTAVALLMPESRSELRPRIDLGGVLISSAGLSALTYGLIRAGQNGWSDLTAVATILAGAVLLAAFAGWEYVVGRRRSGQPLVELSLFRSAGFTWGTLLSTLVQFALFGIVFAMPQYFLDVRGVNSLGAGFRLLPMIAGLAAGLVIGQKLQSPRQAAGSGPAGRPLMSAKIVAGGGFALMAAGLAVGAGTSVASGTGFTAAWITATGLGLGLAMPTALNAALGALTPDRSGSGSALMTAMRQVGGTIGVAVLGTVLASVYRTHLSLTGITAAASAGVADAARSSVGDGVAVAGATRSAPLLHAVRTAYVQGMDVMLWACGGIALTAALLALAFLPRWADTARPRAADGEPTADVPAPALAGVPAAAGVPAVSQAPHVSAPATARDSARAE